MIEENEKDQGLHPPRYEVLKLNDPEGKHNACRYFVLDPRHDPHARYALATYAAQADDAGNHELCNDILDWLEEINLEKHRADIMAEINELKGI